MKTTFSHTIISCVRPRVDMLFLHCEVLRRELEFIAKKNRGKPFCSLTDFILTTKIFHYGRRSIQVGSKALFTGILASYSC